MSLFERLRTIIAPGQDIGYAALLEALKAAGYNTAGIGMELREVAFRGSSGEWRGSEFVSYRVPSFDDEYEGDWTEGELRVVRRGEPDG